MKISDYIASVVGPYHPFVVQGGAAVHLIDSLARGGHKYVCAAHEQAAGFAADGFAKVKGLGVAVTTCGPGATNLTTPAASAFFEGVPVLYLVGQQHVFQEMDVVGMFRGVTQYAKQVTDPKTLPNDLDDALALAVSSRGPVLLNIFDEVYYAETEAVPVVFETPMWDAPATVTDSAGLTMIFGNKRKPLVESVFDAAGPCVNPYRFVDHLLGWPQAIVTDIGNHGVWVKQVALESGRQVISDNNFGAMGYAIASAMGVACAGEPVACVTGDGSIQMNIQELATIAKHDMNIKIFILNDKGYGMIRATQDRWLAGRHSGCDLSDLPLVDFERVATAYGVPNRRWDTHEDFDFEEVFAMKGPVLVNVTVDPTQGVY